MAFQRSLERREENRWAAYAQVRTRLTLLQQSRLQTARARRHARGDRPRELGAIARRTHCRAQYLLRYFFLRRLPALMARRNGVLARRPLGPPSGRADD
jgi:hypothetical protein